MKKNNYKISVVIPIYNVEKYLEEAIQSIINQTIGFENIQLILINDGSPQNEQKICNKYKEKYKNVIYIEQENKGVSAARNNGIKYATGKYINFLDPDDKLTPNALEIGYKMLEEHKEINIVAFRQKFFEASTKYHAIDYKFKEFDYIVDITKDYNCIQLSAAASLIRMSALKNIKFDEKLKISEDAKLMTEILFKNKEKKYALVSSANYLYRKRKVRNSKIQTSGQDISNYAFTSKNVYKYVFELSKKEFGKIIDYAQYFVMYHLQYKLKNPAATNLTKNELDEHNLLLQELLQDIDDKIILEQQTTNIDDKIHALNIKYKKDKQNEIKIKNKNVLFKNIKIDDIENEHYSIIDIKNNKNHYTLSIALKKYLLPYINIEINNNKIDYKISNKQYNSYEQFKEYSPIEEIIEINLNNNKNNIIKIYANNIPLKISGEGKMEILRLDYSQYRINNYYLFKNKQILYFSKKNIKTIKNTLLTNLNLLKTNKNAFILNILYYPGKIIYKNKNIVYINDLNEKYIKDYFKKNNININEFYVIKNDKKPRSLKFKLMYLNAKNIYFFYDDVITNPFGLSYKSYTNKIETNHKIFITNETTNEYIEKQKNKYKHVEFIKIKK